MLSLASIGTMHPSDFHNDLLRLRYLIRSSRRPPRHRYGSPLLPNLTSDTCRPCYPDGSLVWLPLSTYQYYGLPYTDTRSATIIKFTRLLTVQPSKRPISLSFRNSRLLIAQTPLLRTTKAYGQLLGRDFNPLAKLLLLRTSVPYCFTGLQTPSRFNFSYQIFAAKLTSFRNSKCSPFCPITYNPLRIAYVATLSGMTMPATAPEIRLSL